MINKRKTFFFYRVSDFLLFFRCLILHELNYETIHLTSLFDSDTDIDTDTVPFTINIYLITTNIMWFSFINIITDITEIYLNHLLLSSVLHWTVNVNMKNVPLNVTGKNLYNYKIGKLKTCSWAEKHSIQLLWCWLLL